MRLETGEKTLQQIVSTVASSLELTEVLRAVVKLMSDASGVHACFAYLLDDEGDRLVLRAASPPYEKQAGKVVMERGEGLAWWAAERGEPAFIRENALADPRTKYFPELEEERFQSLLAVPVVGRSGDVIGVITAHSEAPREFSDDEVDFLVTSASLVAGAIENARLYEEARLRVAELEQLTELAEAIARAEGLEELLRTVAAAARPLLAANVCHLYLLDPGSEVLERRASDPEPGTARESLGLAELGPELARGGRSSRLAVPLVANGELIGLLVAEGSARVELGRAVASQVAVGLKKVQVIEQLTEKNLIKDFFEELSGGRPRGDLEGRAARLGCDLEQPHVVVIAEPADDALERSLRTAAPGSLFDRREDSLRALLRLPMPSAEALLGRLRRIQADLPTSGIRRRLQRLPRRAELRGRVRRGAAGAPRHEGAQGQAGGPVVRGPRRLQVPPAGRDGRWHPRRHRRRRRRSSPSTTRNAAPSSSRRSRSSSAATATSARPRRRSSSTRTRFASVSAGSPSSRGSTSAATTG